jgi:hypothetical protein
MENKKLKQAWFCGGGTQSVAVGALIVQGYLPKPDVSLIADTGRECSSTWAYLENVLNPAMAKVGVTIERVKASEYGYGGQELWSKTDELLIPAYTTLTGGDPAKLSAFCNRWWKLDAMRVYLSKIHGLTRSKYRSWVGFSLDESKRYFRMMEGEEYQKGLIWFPLVERRLRRHQAIELVKIMGWPEPPRSRCWMCPNQRDQEWLEMIENRPTEFQAAVALDIKVRERDPHAWLHKSCKPLGEIDFTAPPEQSELFDARPCDSGVCFL